MMMSFGIRLIGCPFKKISCSKLNMLYFLPMVCLLVNLQAHGIQGKLLDWIQVFLTDRKQWVIINSFQSDESNVTSGVPQGSVLGPLLFLVYVNDLPSTNCSSSLLFTDDTKLFRPITDYNSFQ